MLRVVLVLLPPSTANPEPEPLLRVRPPTLTLVTARLLPKSANVPPPRTNGLVVEMDPPWLASIFSVPPLMVVVPAAGIAAGQWRGYRCRFFGEARRWRQRRWCPEERSLMEPPKTVEALLPPTVSNVAAGVVVFPRTIAAPAAVLVSEAMAGARP